MFQKVVHTSWDHALALLRLALAAVFFAHGAQKALGWYSGPGFGGTMAMFEQMHIAAPLAFLAIAAEFAGGLALFAGLLSRVAALAIAIDMVVAALLVHLPNGFFMNWTGAQTGEGFEFHVLAIAAALLVVANGAGAWSLDYALTKPIVRKPAADQRTWLSAPAH